MSNFSTLGSVRLVMCVLVAAWPIAASMPLSGNETSPSIRLPDGKILRTIWHPEAEAKTREAFVVLLPFQSFLFHTVSSGQNLVFLMPSLGNQLWMKPMLKEGVRARSSSEPGTMFFRHDQMCVLTYGYSRDHESFMPPVLSVLPEDLHFLTMFGNEVWENQLKGESKKVFTLTFLPTASATRRTIGPSLVSGPFLDGLTGHQAVDDAVSMIREATWQYWVEPPQELVQLMSKGDVRGQEGTNGHIFPPMVIGNGVFMIFTTYAHSGFLNILASIFQDGVAKGDLGMLKLVAQKLKDGNLPYLRSLGLDTLCECFSHFFDAFNGTQAVNEAQVLVRAISLFGALMHGWLVFLFPYRLGAELRRTALCEQIFQLEPAQNAFALLHSREGKGLGAATWNLSSPEERAKVDANAHLPVSLEADDSLPLNFRLQPCASSMSLTHWALEARAVIETLLAEAGAILFRGLPFNFSEASTFLRALGYTMYPDPSGREKVAEGLYHASLAVPPDMNIGPHQEHVTSNEPPSKLFLYCHSPSPEGGETPVAHAGKVWALIPEATKDQLRRRGVRFEMLRGNAAEPHNPVRFTRSWQEHFLTDDLETAKGKVSEQFNGTLIVDKYSNLYLRSPVLQAFRVINGSEIYHSQLQNIYSMKWLWGDADEWLPDEILEDVMGAIWNAATVFHWRPGDLLVVDNTLALHGRLSYRGDRYMAAGLAKD